MLIFFQRCLIMFSTIDLKISKKAKKFSLQTKWVSFEKPFKIKYHRQKKLEVINNARLATSIAAQSLKITLKSLIVMFSITLNWKWKSNFGGLPSIQMRLFLNFSNNVCWSKSKWAGLLPFYRWMPFVIWKTFLYVRYFMLIAAFTWIMRRQRTDRFMFWHGGKI